MHKPTHRLAVATASAIALSVAAANSPALARTHWSSMKCRNTYNAWLHSHRKATRHQKVVYESKLDSKYGCQLVRPKPPARLVPLTGFGADQTTWDAHHTLDPNVPGGYDPMPGAFPGSSDDGFFVSFVNGKVENYFQKFRPGTAQVAASASVRALLPSDATLLVNAKNVGPCAAEELTSPSLAAKGPNHGNGGIIITYYSYYDLGSATYDSLDVREAFVQGLIGPPIPPKQLNSTNSAVCG